MKRKLALVLFAILFVQLACNKPVKEKQSPTPFSFAIPTATQGENSSAVLPTPQTSPAPQQSGESQPSGTWNPPEGWKTYTNSLYGYRVTYPPEAKLTTKGVEGTPTDEIPEGMSLNDYLADLTRKYGKELCVTIRYQQGYVTISAPTNVGYRYTKCGKTGVGVGEITSASEQVVISGQIYEAKGRDFVSSQNDYHDEVFWVTLPDNTQITYGYFDGDPAKFDTYTSKTKPVLRKIVESYDSTIPGSFDWSTYQKPSGSSQQGDLPDKAAFLGDITIPDGTIFKPGESFEKTWRLMNNGASTWTKSFSLQFVSGERMGAAESLPLNAEVPPGGVLDVTVEFTAPEEEGEYTGYWRLKDEFGHPFGVGETGTEPIWLTIAVARDGSEGATATPGGSGATVTGASLSIDKTSYNGSCPVTLNFTGVIHAQGAGSFEYKFIAGASTPGFEFTLPGSQTASFHGDGSHDYPVDFFLTIESSVNGWARIEISKPNSRQSNTVSFTVTCK